MIKIGVLGARGRMGQLVSRLLATEFQGEVSEIISGDREIPLGSLLSSDAVIDFSSPDAVVQLARAAATHTGRLPVLVVGSTGWNLEQKKQLEALAAKTQVLMSSNFSTGVLAFLEIMKQAAPLLQKLGYMPVLLETHHRHKKDAPSGTALSLQRAVSPSGPGNVQTYSVRAGEIIGDHEVTYYGAGDHLAFGHFAQDRSIFARGAIQCALWLETQRAQAGTGKILSIDSYFKAIQEQLK